jgi:glutaconate CoA-transferase, subunit A
LTISLALQAAASGIGFMPTRTALGSDLYATNPSLKYVNCPFSGEKHAAVAAIAPDAAIIHVQRSDVFGNAHSWGNMGISREACMASRRIILTAEEIVPTEVIVRDPNRVLTPSFKVSAVVHAPWGAHPSPVPGYYNRDHQVFLNYKEQSRTPDRFQSWLDENVFSIRDIFQYHELLGEDRQKALLLTHHSFSEAVDYGY